MKPLLPDVWFNIRDGALGLSGAPTDNVHAKVGVASAGDVGVIHAFTTVAQALETLGGGPLAEAVAFSLAVAGGPVYAVRVPASVAGTVSAGAISKTGTGTVTVAGQPTDACEVRIEITRDGINLAAGTAAFKYSLDGGDTYSPEIAVPSGGTYALSNTGLTATFANGSSGTSFKAGDAYRFTATAPAMQLADVLSAIDVLLADSREWGWVHVVGAATPALAAGLAVKMAEAEAAYRFAFALLEAPDQAEGQTEDQWMAALLADWADFADVRVGVAAGHEELVSPLTGRVHRRSAAWPLSARLAQIPVHEHAGRVATGPLAGIVRLHHDEFVKPGLDAARFSTLRTFIGRSGFYPTAGRLMAPEGSDYAYIENRRVMDLACKIVRRAMLRYLNDAVAVDGEGNIRETDAAAIESYVKGKLQAELLAPGHASDVIVRLKRDSNVLATRSTTLTIRVLPLGYLSWIEMDIGFRNPKLEAAA